MDINNELQQINTFVKGMNTDVSDALMDSSQYRYAENVRLATNTDENTGELRLIEGNAQFPYNLGEIKAMTSIRNILIVVTKEDKIYKNEDGTGWSLVYKPAEGDTGFGDHLSLVTRWESDNNVKLYIADGIHRLMYVNIMDRNTDGTDKIVEGISSIQNIVETFLNQPSAEVSLDQGNINAIKVQYAYRLYRLGGSSTSVSPLSKLLVLYESENKGYPTAGDGTLEISKSVMVYIPDIPVEANDCDYLQIFRIAYVSTSINPIVSLIYDDLYQSQYLDYGYNVDEVDYSELLSYLGSNTVPAVIESKQDYLFAANIRDVQTETDEAFKDVELRALSSGDYDNGTVLQYNRQFSDLNSYNEQYWRNPENPSVLGGVGDYISWEYADSNTIYIDTTNKKYTSIGSSPIREQIRSLRPGEVYRYGAVLYDDKGNHSSAKWIADIMIPDDRYGSIEIDNLYQFKQLGIKFNINWDAIHSVYPSCKAIEIVRSVRTANDRLTITQGIAGYPLRIYDKENDEIKSKPILCSPGILSTNRFAITGHMKLGEHDSVNFKDKTEQTKVGISDNKYLLFASPEYVYQKSNIQNILNSSSQIYVKKEGTAKCQCLNSKYWYTNPVDSNTQNLIQNQLRIFRIGTKDDAYDHGVPYAVQLAPTDISLLYSYLHDRYNITGNKAPTYNEWATGEEHPNDSGIYTFIHSAWIANYFAIEATDPRAWDYGNYPNYPGFINRNANYWTKIYISASEWDVELIQDKTINQIKNKGYSNVPRYDSLFDEGIFKGSDDVSTIGSTSYLNWIVPIAVNDDTNAEDVLLGEGLDLETDIVSGKYTKLQTTGGQFTYPIGSTGECVILEQNESTPFANFDNNKISSDIVSIKHYVQPYNGQSTISTQKYTSFGNIVLDNQYSVEIYDGDCFPGVFIYNASHAWAESNFGGGIGQANVQMIPLYSDIDLSATFGDLFPNIVSTDKYWFQDVAVTINTYSQDKDAYRYNTAYGIDPSGRPYGTIDYTTIDTGLYDTRIFHSSPKINNEHIDSWLKFGQFDYIDVDSRFGQITNLKLFKDKLLFWQEHATGIVSVNERTILNDLENNDIVLGTGGVLQRYDYISTIYGMKPRQYDAEIQSNYTQYWWDGYNKEILAYTGGIELTPLTKTKGLTNYVNQREESDHPMLAYDTKYDEVLAQVVEDEVSNNTIVYNEQIQAFSSIYTFTPLYRTSIGNDLYLTDSTSIYLHNKQDIKNQSVLFNIPIFPKVKIVVNKNNIYTKTFDNITFGGRMYNGSFVTLLNTPLRDINGLYIEDKDHMNSPMHHLKFTFETPLKQQSSVRGDNAISVDEYDYRLAIPRNGSYATVQTIGDDIKNIERKIEYGNRMRGKTMQCEIASDYNSTDFSLQYITTKFRMSWS